MKKILYVILHGSVNSDRYYNVIDTWGKNVDCLFYSDHEDFEKNIIKVSDKTHYGSNEEKHVNIIKYLHDFLESYEWFFFCDDDTFVNTKKLESNLYFFDTQKVHGQLLKTDNIIGKPESIPVLEYLSGGAGYLIHQTILKKIIENIKIFNTGYADVTLGICMNELNIPISNSNYFLGQSPSFYGISKENYENQITFHYIKTKDEMVEILENIN